MSESTGGSTISASYLPSFGSGAANVGPGGGSAAIQGPQPSIKGLTGVEVQLDPTPVLPGAPFPVDIENDFASADAVQAFALARANEANNYIRALSTLATSLVPQTINPQFPELGEAPALAVPVAPEITVPVYDPPDVPTAFTQNLSVDSVFPLFSDGPPALTFPNAPVAPSLTLPDAPAVDLNFAYPTVDVELPPAPALLSIEVQPFKGVDFPTLTATAPVLTAVAPSIVGYVPGAPYTDALLSSVVMNLKSRIDIGNTGKNTGLPAIVEQGIWNRGREREYRQQADAIKALNRYETMGYAFPPGAFIDAQIKIQTDSMATIAGNSREVAINQANLEQENLKNAYAQATEIESKLIDYANQTEQRRFEAMRYMTEAGISIYNAQVQAYSAIVQAYRAAIEVYQAQMEGAKTTVEIYQAEISAEKLKVDANTALVEQYKVRVDAALASIQVFEGEISLIKTQAEVEQLKVSIFGEEVRSYAAQAQLFSTEVEAYKSGIEAQNAKQQVYATSANVYATLVNATAKEIDSQLEVYKTKLQAKNLEVEVYKAQVQSEAERVRSIAAADQAITQIYSATVQGQSAYNSVLVEEYKTALTIAEQVTQIGVSAADANGKLYLSAASIATDAAKVGAQVEAQLGASALGAVTFATHRSRQDSLGYSVSTNYGNTKSISQSNSVSQGQSTSVSSSMSASVSASTSTSASYAQNTNIAEAQ